MSEARGPAPGYRRYPEHTIAIHAAESRWQVRGGNELVADSTAALVVEESGYAPTVYFPRADVHFERLTASESKTSCPFKGEAAYWRLASSRDSRDVAWSYPATYEEAADIAGLVAFYADRVTITEIEGN